MSAAFNPHYDQGETYAELLEYAAEGYNIPAARLTHAKRLEANTAAAAKEAGEIRTALQNAAAERAKRRAALDAKYLPQLKEMLNELAELDQAADTARAAAREAIKDYRTAATKSLNKYYSIRNTVESHYGEPAFDNDGNPTDDTYVRYGMVTINGEPVRCHWMPEVMHSPEIGRL